MRLPGRALLLLALALLLRLGWAAKADTALWFDHVFNDATAVSLAEGRGFTASVEPPYDPAVFRTPGYPLFVSGIYRLAGRSVRAVFLVQAVLSTISCLLLFRLANSRLGRGPGLWVLFLAATYPFEIWTVGTMSPEVLLVFLGLLLVSVVDAWPSSGAPLRILLAGVLGGLLVWVKPVFLPLPVFLLLTERFRRRDWTVALCRAVAVGALMAALFAPWVLRNHRAFGEPVLAGELGLVVWHGTYDFETERDTMVAKNFAAAAKDPGDRYEATRKRFTDSHQLLEDDAEFLERGLDRIRARPLRGFVLDPLRRIPRLWISTSFVGGPNWLGLGAAAGCVGYLLLGAIGLWLLRGRLRDLGAFWLLPVLMTAAYALIHVEARYTLPARPSLLFLGGVALAAIWGRISPGPTIPNGASTGTSSGRS